MSDFPLATDHHTPSQYWFDSINPIAIVIHETGGDRDLPSLFNTFNTSNRSVHYGIGRDDKGNDGAIWQFVPESHGAGGNCCLETGHDPFWDSLHARYNNLNLCTLSVEHCNADLQNMAPLTQAQIETSFKLIAYWVKKYNIPLTNIKGHSSLDPLDRKNCPGPYYPWAELFAYLQGDSVKLNGNGCVVDTTRWYQLETEQLANVPGSPQGTHESEDLCGPGCVIITALSNEPNKGRLVYNGVQVDAEFIDRATDDMVDAYGKAHADGFNHINWLGANDSDMIWFLNYARDKYQRTHYQTIGSPTIDKIRIAVRAGYPVLYSCNELDIQEKRTGAHPPYPWRLSAGHIIAVTGIDKDGDFICPDILNNAFQNYWPVTYVANSFAGSLSWACIIKLPFLKDIPNGDPTSWPQGYTAQNFGGTPPMNWPSQGMQQQAQDTWLITAKLLQSLFGERAPYTTGIAAAWQERYKQGKNYGPPVCTELPSVDWSNKPIKVQLFASGVRAEWDGSCHFYDKDGPLS